MLLRLGVLCAALAVVGCDVIDDFEREFDGPVANDPNIPDTAYCGGVITWEVAYSDFEETILQMVNSQRAQGANCGSYGSFGAAGPLVMNGMLRCSARQHSTDMFERGFFDHIKPDGEDPFDRMARAGYEFRAAGENIAQGYPTPGEVMAGWMGSDGHCANIMEPAFEELGVGLYDGDTWTQNFGAR